LFDQELPEPGEALWTAVFAAPTALIRKTQEWAIGNVGGFGAKLPPTIQNFDLYFRIGRRTFRKTDVYNETDHSFIEVEQREAPYADAVLLLPEGVLAISPRPKLIVKPQTVAVYFAGIIEEWLNANNLRFGVTAGRIIDPSDLIRRIRQAEYIERFRFTFSPKNPFDASDFVVPLKEFLGEVKGRNGEVIVRGDSMDKADLEKLAREAAATAEKASATLKSPDNSRAATYSLGENVASVATEAVDLSETSPDLIEIARLVRERYNGIRRASGIQNEQG